MSETKISVEISADSSKLVSGLQLSSAELDKLKAHLDGIAKSYQTVTQSAQQSAVSMTTMGSAATSGGERAANALRKAGDSAHVSSGQIRETLVVMRELARGDFTRLAGSLTLLAQYSGALPALLNPVSLAVAALTAAIGGMAYAMHVAADDQVHFQNALKGTNNWAGLTESQIHNLAETLGRETHEGAGKARDELLLLARDGTFTGKAFEMVAKTALDMAHAFGGDASTYTKQLDGLQSKTVETTYKLQQHYHMLTAAQFEHVIALVKQADATGDFQKRQEAIQLVLGKLDGQFKDQAENLGYLEKAWRGLTQAIGDAIEAMMNWGRAPSTAEKLKSEQEKLNTLQAQAASHSFRTASAAQSQLAAQQAIVNALQKQLNLEQQNAAAKSKQLQADSPKIDKDFQAYKDSRKPKADKSRFSEWSAALAAELDDKKNYFANALIVEQQFWQSKLSQVKKDSTEEFEIQRRLHSVRAQIARQAFSDEMSELKAQQSARVSALAVKPGEIAANFNEQKSKYAELAAENIISKKKEMDALVALTRQERDAQIQALADIHAAMQAGYNDQIALAKKVGADFTKIESLKKDDQAKYLAQRELLERQYATKISQQQDKAAIEATRPFREALNGVSQSWQTALNQLLLGQQRFGNTLKAMWNGLAEQIVGGFTKRLFMIGEAQILSLAKVKTSQDAAAASSIFKDARVAAAGAYAATAPIPFVGPVLAPAAAAAAFAGTMAFAAKGYDIGNENPVTQLHKREMVLPEGLADRVRNMTDNGGSGDVHLHVHATDSQSVARLFKDNGKALAATLRTMQRNGLLTV